MKMESIEEKFVRTHGCGTLRVDNVGQKVSILGWVSKKRNLGSLLFLDVGRKKFDSEKINYEIMQKLIFDEVTKVRESVGWLLYRLSLHKDPPSHRIRRCSSGTHPYPYNIHGRSLLP